MSLLLSIFDEKAMAFGGVDIGKAMAKEHDKASILTNKIWFSPGIAMATGTIKFAVAVLLINVDIKMATMQKTTTSKNPL